jgi:hypothetical protein
MEGLRNTRIAAVQARCCTDQLQAALQQYFQNRASDVKNVAKVGAVKCVDFLLYCIPFHFASPGRRNIGLLPPAEQM